MKYHYVWLLWSLAFLGPWLILYVAAGSFRRDMLRISALTSLLGFSEPFFVPEYWNPPSLLDLAQRTGFDIESLIFSFAIGGIGAASYDVLTRRRFDPVPSAERHALRHRIHLTVLMVPFAAVPLFYFLGWNPIHAAIAALALGNAAAVVCRPDLWRGTLLGGMLFAALYGVFMILLVVFTPGYIEQVWNLPALSRTRPAGIPLEELAFGLAFGAYWASAYEHFTWRHRVRPKPFASSAAMGIGGRH
jgi:hypothetical protein